ncbi:MAG: DUF3990 domain-containing protein [Proteobacteria bacterium]|nr:DUF3990 domain-containing protein [Pseudomonadota bacterium]
MKEITARMLLYHGSYCVVEEPNLDKCAKYKDFGQGFYLTSSKRQARSFAKIATTKAKNDGIIPANTDCGYISCFKVNDISDVSCYYFPFADVDWLHCIVAHRRKRVFVDLRKQLEDYDVIVGKIANDDTNTTINAYMSHVFGKMGSSAADKMCIGLLIPERLQDQFCFRSAKALSKLSFQYRESIVLG